jgi:hypothetical protein
MPPLPIRGAPGWMVGRVNTRVFHHTDEPNRPQVSRLGTRQTLPPSRIWLTGRRSSFFVRPYRPTIQPKTALYRSHFGWSAHAPSRASDRPSIQKAVPPAAPWRSAVLHISAPLPRVQWSARWWARLTPDRRANRAVAGPDARRWRMLRPRFIGDNTQPCQMMTGRAIALPAPGYTRGLEWNVPENHGRRRQMTGYQFGPGTPLSRPRSGTRS